MDYKDFEIEKSVENGINTVIARLKTNKTKGYKISYNGFSHIGLVNRLFRILNYCESENISIKDISLENGFLNDGEVVTELGTTDDQSSQK